MLNQESRAVSGPKTGLTRRGLLRASAVTGLVPLLGAAPARSLATQGTLLLCDQRSQSVILVESQTLLSTRGRSLDLSRLWSWNPASDPGLSDLAPARSWVNVSEATQAVTSRGCSSSPVRRGADGSCQPDPGHHVLGAGPSARRQRPQPRDASGRQRRHRCEHRRVRPSLCGLAGAPGQPLRAVQAGRRSRGFLE